MDNERQRDSAPQTSLPQKDGLYSEEGRKHESRLGGLEHGIFVSSEGRSTDDYP